MLALGQDEATDYSALKFSKGHLMANQAIKICSDIFLSPSFLDTFFSY